MENDTIYVRDKFTSDYVKDQHEIIIGRIIKKTEDGKIIIAGLNSYQMAVKIYDESELENYISIDEYFKTASFVGKRILETESLLIYQGENVYLWCFEDDHSYIKANYTYVGYIKNCKFGGDYKQELSNLGFDNPKCMTEYLDKNYLQPAETKYKDIIEELTESEIDVTEENIFRCEKYHEFDEFRSTENDDVVSKKKKLIDYFKRV